MSERRACRITDDEINELIAKLHSLLPESYRRRAATSRVSSASAPVISRTFAVAVEEAAASYSQSSSVVVVLQSPASKLLKDMCSYIKSLHREVDDLSERLSELMATMDSNSPQADIIRSLLR
ncbi:hypothetical protein GUJ93_ZPchr0010g9416 [Zizania palustris]|uniref:BHLH domain-containing protein n=1 Tax=Zizania palustris TaxID=103762 RepID=A0A8J5WHA5_ZIZPA|nr:hypothetical protein GUJ93_ZPchr0010g9416 [Zizania palustris]